MNDGAGEIGGTTHKSRTENLFRHGYQQTKLQDPPFYTMHAHGGGCCTVRSRFALNIPVERGRMDTKHNDNGVYDIVQRATAGSPPACS